MKFPNGIKYAAIGLMLFAAVVVDFASKFMSVFFDLFFVSVAIWIAYPMIKNKEK